MTPTRRLTQQQQLDRAAARRLIDAAARAGITAGDVPHAHTAPVTGCFRCELNEDEQ